ncbi:hypothetical protein DNTS_000415 [Danionella cerebrum]|uniref:Aquaporin n=1 Tax=Danionella cerebrum TaxID=2873325 RepID=A0A553QZM8_9TELE|nr:hypothetical protein DNTS_000415 [Danionella translucida]
MEYRENMKNLRGKCTLRKDIIREFLAELLGTFVLILFGCGSVAQTVLSRETKGELLTIHIGFTLGVMLAVYMAGGISGGHVNPAVSLGMVILGKLPLKKFPIYVAAQFIGAFLGSCAVFCLYYGKLPSHFNIITPLSLEVIGTGALVLCILAIIDKKNIGAPKGMEPLLVGLSILAIAVSMALNCGYPINPARDLGPRLFTAVAGWGLDVFRYGKPCSFCYHDLISFVVSAASTN